MGNGTNFLFPSQDFSEEKQKINSIRVVCQGSGGGGGVRVGGFKSYKLHKHSLFPPFLFIFISAPRDP